MGPSERKLYADLDRRVSRELSSLRQKGTVYKASSGDSGRQNITVEGGHVVMGELEAFLAAFAKELDRAANEDAERMELKDILFNLADWVRHYPSVNEGEK